MLRWSPGERVKGRVSRSLFGPLAAHSWIRYAKPQILRKQTKPPDVQKLAVIKPPQPEKSQRSKSIMSALAKRLLSFEFWLGVFAGVATRTAAKFIIHSAVISAYGPKAETAANFAACAIAGMVAGFIVHLVRTCYRNSIVLDAEKQKYFGKAAFKSAITGLLGGTLGGGLAELGSLFMTTNMLAAGAGTGALATIPASIAKSVHTALQAGHEALKTAAKEFSHDNFKIELPKSLLQSNNWPGVMHTQEGFTPSHSMLTTHAAPHSLHVSHHAHHQMAHKHFASRQSVHHTTHHHRTYASRKEYLHHQRVVNGRYYTRFAAQNQERLIHEHLAHANAVSSQPPGTLPDIKGPCADPGTSCQEHVYFDQNGDATKVVLEPGPVQPQAAHFDAQHADITPDASKVSYIVPFNRAAVPALS